MNGLLPSLLPLVLFTLLALPLLAAAWFRSAALLRLALGYSLMVSGAVALGQSTLLAPRVPGWVTTEAMFSQEAESERCAEVLAAFDQYGVFAQPPRRGSLVVVRELWDALPEEARQIAQMCAARDGIPADIAFAPEG